MLRRKLFNKKDSDGDSEGRSPILDLSLTSCAPSEVSKYFPNAPRPQFSLKSPIFAEKLLEIHLELNEALKRADFRRAPVEYVYNPTEYARAPFEMFLRKFADPDQKILMVGMNPGPFGMCQTGVPFGDVAHVKNWLRIDATDVHRPAPECPDRPVHGFDCRRKEQSGDRFWSLFEELCGEPERFFRNCYVYNWCPMAFMDKAGRNLTPAELKDCKQLESICDEFYRKIFELFKPEIVIAIGRYVEKRSKKIIPDNEAKVLCMPHPSPRAKNNQNWPEKAKNFLEINNLMQYFLK